MKKSLSLFAILYLGLFTITCCSPMLLPVQTNTFAEYSDYQYFYITPTAEVNSVSGGTYGNQYRIYGSTQSFSVNPADEIAGYLMPKGYIRVPDIPKDKLEQTLIINYGVTGRRKLNASAYTTAITIQVLSAKSLDVLCTGTAEGVGKTETDDIRIAINRCMSELFK